MARRKPIGWAAVLAAQAKHRRQPQPRDEYGRFTLREVIPLTERERAEIPKQRELVRQEIRRIRKKKEIERALTYPERIELGRADMGMHVDPDWADDLSFDFDVDLHDVYDDYFGYGEGSYAA